MSISNTKLFKFMKFCLPREAFHQDKPDVPIAHLDQEYGPKEIDVQSPASTEQPASYTIYPFN